MALDIKQDLERQIFGDGKTEEHGKYLDGKEGLAAGAGAASYCLLNPNRQTLLLLKGGEQQGTIFWGTGAGSQMSYRDDLDGT